MIPEPEYLFVYGTLMRGFDNPFAEKLREHSVFEGNGSFPGLLYKVEWYPGAIYLPESPDLVYGEVYQIQDAADLLRELDGYEEVIEEQSASLYLRKIIPVKMEDQRMLNCWTYLYNQTIAGLTKIISGNFREV